MWRTRRDFDIDLFESYKKSGLQRAEPIVPMGSALIVVGAKGHKVKLPKKVSVALSVLDDLILDAIIWQHSFGILLLNAKPTENQYLHRSLMALFMRVAQDAMVIRNLIRTGFDAQAKNLLRSLDEHADAICYLCLKPEVCSEFVQTEDEDSGNKFWWKHLRHSRQIIDAAIVKKLAFDAELRSLSEFRGEERRLLSAVHHPTYMASTLPFYVPYKSVNITKAMFGLPSEHSIRTGKFLFYILAELALYVGLLNKEVNQLISRKRGGELQQFVRKGRTHLGMMVVHLAQNWKSPLFATSGEMEKFLKRLHQRARRAD